MYKVHPQHLDACTCTFVYTYMYIRTSTGIYTVYVHTCIYTCTCTCIYIQCSCIYSIWYVTIVWWIRFCGWYTCFYVEVNTVLCIYHPAICMQVSEEYLRQARAVEKKWRRDRQSERDLRLRLQENLETMASQIHGLESEAQRSAEGRGLLHSHRSQKTSSREDASTLHPANQPPTQSGGVGGEVYGEGGREGGDEDDEETFFDANEMSTGEWLKLTKAEFLESCPSIEGEREEEPVATDRPPFNSKSMKQVSNAKSECVK